MALRERSDLYFLFQDTLARPSTILRDSGWLLSKKVGAVRLQVVRGDDDYDLLLTYIHLTDKPATDNREASFFLVMSNGSENFCVLRNLGLISTVKPVEWIQRMAQEYKTPLPQCQEPVHAVQMVAAGTRGVICRQRGGREVVVDNEQLLVCFRDFPRSGTELCFAVSAPRGCVVMAYDRQREFLQL